jgi:hypothetical protein
VLVDTDASGACIVCAVCVACGCDEAGVVIPGDCAHAVNDAVNTADKLTLTHDLEDMTRIRNDSTHYARPLPIMEVASLYYARFMMNVGNECKQQNSPFY